MTSLYIISSPLHEKAGQFKVGIHTGDIKKLVSRYRTAIPGIDVKLFVSVMDGKAREIEDKVKANFSSNRITGSGGNESEFYQISLKALYTFIFPFLPDVAPVSSEENDKKYQEELKEFSNVMAPIGQQLNNMETYVPQGYGSMTDLLREIKVEKDKFMTENFRGEHLLTIRKLVMENYSKCQLQSQPFYGSQIIESMRQITRTMDEANKKFPGTFKKVPRIIELNMNGTEKDDMIFRRVMMFGQLAVNGSYVSTHWDALLDVSPDDWQYLRSIRFEYANLPPKKYIQKYQILKHQRLRNLKNLRKLKRLSRIA
jgi:hypothetical protein